MTLPPSHSFPALHRNLRSKIPSAVATQTTQSRCTLERSLDPKDTNAPCTAPAGATLPPPEAGTAIARHMGSGDATLRRCHQRRVIGAHQVLVDGETMLLTRQDLPEEVGQLLHEIEIVSEHLVQLEQRATELTARDVAVDGGNVVYLAPAVCSGWGKHRKLGR
jgi:hypothetical protein